MLPTTPTHALRPAQAATDQPTQTRRGGPDARPMPPRSGMTVRVNDRRPGQGQPGREPVRDAERRTERDGDGRPRGFRRDERPSDDRRRDDRRPNERGPRRDGRPVAPRRFPAEAAPAGVRPVAERSWQAEPAPHPVTSPQALLDTPSPVTPAISFDEMSLRPQTRAAVAAMGITTPTPIQSQGIPAMMSGRDVVGQARTGSGKTLAFGIPIVERCEPSARFVQALVLVPTRELAIQVGDVIRGLAEARGLRLTLLHGGRSLSPEVRALAGGAQIVVGTPGRTLDHLRQGSLSLQRLRVFVLDEGDEMLDRGFAPDVERILARTPTTRQTALFSATVPAWVMETAARHLQPGDGASRSEGRSASGDRARRLRGRSGRPTGCALHPAGSARRWLDHRVRAHQARREEARPEARDDGLPGRRAPGEPQPECARACDGGVPLGRDADLAGDERRRPWP